MNYINENQLKNDYEHLRVLNLFNDELSRKKIIGYEILIDDVARDIPEVPGYGSYVISVFGVEHTLPTGVFAVSKSDITASGSVAPIVSQVGTGSWAGNAIIVTSSATSIQIAHDRASTSANFNITISGII